jgi:hypothetical protein
VVTVLESDRSRGFGDVATFESIVREFFLFVLGGLKTDRPDLSRESGNTSPSFADHFLTADDKLTIYGPEHVAHTVKRSALVPAQLVVESSGRMIKPYGPGL